MDVRRNERSMLVVTTVPGMARAFLLPYARHFRDKGWTVDLATGPGNVDEPITSAFDSVTIVPWGRSLRNPARALPALAEFRKLVTRNAYDVVHTHSPVASMLARLAIRTIPKARRPVVVYTAHGFHFHPRGSAKENLLFTTLERIGGRWTDLLIVINDEDYQQTLRGHIVPEDRVVHLPGIGVDLDHFRPTPELLEDAKRFREDNGIDDDRVVLAMVAEFTPRKNHKVAVEALRRHPEPRPLLLLAGVGHLTDEVRRQVSEAGLDDDVRILGTVREIRPLMLACDATLLPSRREGLARAVLESLAMGVPVIGGDSRGIADLIDAETGVLVHPDDIDGFTQAMQDVLKIPGRGAMRSAVESRMTTYSQDTLIRRHEELYDALLERRRSRGGR